MKILIADDHFLILEGLKDLVVKHYPTADVFLAVNKTELFDVLEKQNIQILIQDIKFGNDHASDFIGEITKSYPAIKTLVLSSISDPSTIQKLYNKTEGYILKTESSNCIVSAIENVLNNKKYLSPEAEKITNRVFSNDMIAPLTKRELDVIKEIMKELPNKIIAENLNISEKTVEMHRANIFLKLDVSNITGLVKKVIGLGLIEN